MRLGIDPSVVPNWGIQEALREVIQGAIDACGNDYIISYDEITQRLVIENPGELSHKTLLIGNSDKRDDSTKIGQHGEGYKLSAAILLRNDRRFTIYNDKEVWRFSYKYDRNFKTNVINVDISKWFIEKTGTIKWEIYDITLEEFETFENNIIDYSDLQGSNGGILLDRPGDVFSGGLFVCNKKELSFGYNFDVGVLKLQRDRDLLSDFDIFWETSRCWSTLPDSSTHLRDRIPDVKYINQFIDSNTTLSNKIVDMFIADHGPNANPCTYESEKIEGTKNIIVNPEHRAIIINNPRFNMPSGIHIDTPYEILSKWHNKLNKETYIDLEDLEDFKKILLKSEGWYE